MHVLGLAITKGNLELECVYPSCPQLFIQAFLFQEFPVIGNFGFTTHFSTPPRVWHISTLSLEMLFSLDGVSWSHLLPVWKMGFLNYSPGTSVERSHKPAVYLLEIFPLFWCVLYTVKLLPCKLPTLSFMKLQVSMWFITISCSGLRHSHNHTHPGWV